MLSTGRLKDFLRRVLGDRITSRLHGYRLSKLAWRNWAADADMKYASSLLKEGDTIIDVGANGADWTLAFSKSVGITGSVVAFEPHPYYAMATESAIRFLRLANVKLFAYGLGEQEASAKLLTQEGGGASFAGRSRIVTSLEDGQRSSEISIRRLDDIAEEQGFIDRVSLLKIDTEGFELSVLRGSKTLIERSRPVIVIEVGHEWLHGFSSSDLEKFISEIGYKIYLFDAYDQELVPLEGLEAGKYEISQNRFLLPA